jgi:hypothetical protein
MAEGVSSLIRTDAPSSSGILDPLSSDPRLVPFHGGQEKKRRCVVLVMGIEGSGHHMVSTNSVPQITNHLSCTFLGLFRSATYLRVSNSLKKIRIVSRRVVGFCQQWTKTQSWSDARSSGLET